MPTYDEIRDLIDTALPDSTPEDSHEIVVQDINDTLNIIVDKIEEVEEGAGGGGSATYAGLTDAATVDLPEVNAPLGVVLDDLQEQIDDFTAGVSGPNVVAFSATIPFTRDYTKMNHTVSGPIAFVPDLTDAIDGGATFVKLIADGVNEPTFHASLKKRPASEDYDNTTDLINNVIFLNNAGDLEYVISVGAVTEVDPQLSTPSFSADATSDTTIELTAITYDGDSTVMIIQRSTSSDFSTALATIHSGSPVSTKTDTPLTASTHYYYRIKTTAPSFTDSAYGYDDDTTDAAGLTPLSTPTLTATVAGSAQINLGWTNVANEVSYMLEWSPNGTSGWTQIGGTIAANTTSYNHTGLSPLTQYFYRITAIADGVTFSNSGYGTDNDTTTAATLSAPTSFAAGTPTSDGVPFTWVDPNSAPANEASFLIQIAIAADTTYTGTIVTRTPAADAVSAAAGTGLTASTAYRARIKAVGNGTSTLDSAYSSEVTFSTAAAAYHPDAVTYFAAFVAAGGTAHTTPEKVQISDGFDAADTAGILPKYKRILIAKGSVAAATMVNAVSPGTGNGTIVGTVTTNNGWVGDGTTGYIASALVPATDCASGEMMASVFSMDDNYTNLGYDFGCGPDSTDSRSSIVLQIKESDLLTPPINGHVQAPWSYTVFNTATANVPGIGVYSVYSRQMASPFKVFVYEDTTVLHDVADPGILPDKELFFLATNGRFTDASIHGFTTRKVAIIAVADGLEATENAAHVAFMNALKTF